MRDFEIAELFGVFVQTIKVNIRAILKSGVCEGDLSNGGTAVGKSIIPDYHGLNMITALAFRIQSPNAELFRKWVFGKMKNTNSKLLQIVEFTNNRICN